MLELWLHLPVQGPTELVHVLDGVSEDQIRAIQPYLLWRQECVTCAGSGRKIATPVFARDVDLTSTNVDVYMQYPPVNGKYSWGKIAENVPVHLTHVFAEHGVRKLSIMPNKEAVQ